MTTVNALLSDLYVWHVALLVSARDARWDRQPELLLIEEQLRAEEELTLAEATETLAELLADAGCAPRLAREMWDCAHRAPAPDAVTALSGLVEGHRAAGALAARLADVAACADDEEVWEAAELRALEHAEAARVLAHLEESVRRRRVPVPPTASPRPALRAYAA